MELQSPLVEGVAEGVTTVLDKRVVEHVSLGREIERLLADTWVRGSLFLDFHEAEGATELEVGPWLSRDHCNSGTATTARKSAGTRKLAMRLPAPAITMRQTIATSITYRISAEDDGDNASLCVETASVVYDIPYGDYFVNCAKTSLVSVDQSVAISKICWTVFKKDTMLRRKITSTAAAEQRKAGELLINVLRQHAAVSVNPIVGKQLSKSITRDATDAETKPAQRLIRAASAIDPGCWHFMVPAKQLWQLHKMKQCHQRPSRLRLNRETIPHAALYSPASFAPPCPAPDRLSEGQEGCAVDKPKKPQRPCNKINIRVRQICSAQNIVAVGFLFSTVLLASLAGTRVSSACGNGVIAASGAVGSFLYKASSWFDAVQVADVMFPFSAFLLLSYPAFLFCWLALQALGAGQPPADTGGSGESTKQPEPQKRIDYCW
jgi:hypothetical protein